MDGNRQLLQRKLQSTLGSGDRISHSKFLTGRIILRFQSGSLHGTQIGRRPASAEYGTAFLYQRKQRGKSDGAAA